MMRQRSGLTMNLPMNARAILVGVQSPTIWRFPQYSQSINRNVITNISINVPTFRDRPPRAGSTGKTN